MQPTFRQLLGRAFGFALIPVIINGIVVLLFEQYRAWDTLVATLFGNGELLLIAFIILVATAGDIIGLENITGNIKKGVIGFCGSCILAIGAVYGWVAHPELLSDPASAYWAGVISLILYGIALVVSSGCIMAARKESGDV